MQLDHAAGNTVIEATCAVATYQTWALSTAGQFISAWDPSQCLTDNASRRN